MPSSPNADLFRNPWLNRAFAFLTSLGLASVILLLLTVITLLGTLNQVEESLFDSQKKYFESLWIRDDLNGFPIWLPGTALLMGLFFINLILGTIVKVRKNWKTIGIHVSHAGMLLLILSSLITLRFAWEGNMALYPGMESNEVLSYHHWQLEILPIDDDGKAEEALVIPHQTLKAIGKGSKTFQSSSLPFTLEVSGYQRNSMPIAASAPIAAKTGGPAVDGFRLLPRPPEKEAEANLAGCYVTLTPTAPGEEPQKVLLWAHVGGNFTERVPHTTTVGGKTYGLQIVRERMQTPFTVKLDEFIFEKYGGSGTAKNYQSNITKVEEGSEERIEIKMNEPMRHRGFTFFQASFGPANAGPDEELYTQFAVVKNPSDHWPLASLIITMLGLFFHMGLKLRDHLNRSSSTGRRANA